MYLCNTVVVIRSNIRSNFLMMVVMGWARVDTRTLTLTMRTRARVGRVRVCLTVPAGAAWRRRDTCGSERE